MNKIFAACWNDPANIRNNFYRVPRSSVRSDSLVYLITCDLKTPGKDYTALIETVENLGQWAKVWETAWFVNTGLNAAQISDRLRRLISGDDRFVVVAVKNDIEGKLLNRHWDWLGERV